MASTVSSSARGVSFLILIQLCSRASTFVVNQALLRYLSPELFGVSIRLELFSITVLYFARESIRVALQRQTSNAQAVVNIGYIASALGLPLSTLLGWRYAASDVSNMLYMKEAINIVSFATLIELASEPCFAVMQQKLQYGIRAIAETSATIARCFVTFATVLWYSKQDQASGALPFAYGQLAYGVVLSSIYFARLAPVALEENFSLLPRKITTSDQSEYFLSYFSRSLCTLGVNLYIQSGIKYVLTQGDAIMIATFATLQDQGVYGLAANYGGLIARVIFQPIEESSRNLFSKLCAPVSEKQKSPSRNSTKRTKGGLDEHGRSKNNSTGRTPKHKMAPSANVQQGHAILAAILRLYTILALVCFSVGPTAAPLLLNLVAGKQWISTGAGSVLAAYTYYVPFLAINGVTEAFVAAVADNAQLRSQSMAMTLYFVGFGGAVYTFLRVAEMGAIGLVYANCVNMGCRIIWNAWFIGGFFASQGITFEMTKVMPTATSIAAAAVAIGALRLENPLHDITSLAAVNDLAWTSGVTAMLGVALLVCERHFLAECYQRFRAST